MSAGTCRHIPCTNALPEPTPGPGRPRLYCGARCRTNATTAAKRRPEVAELVASTNGEILDVELIAAPHDAAAWADALAAVAGALEGTSARSSWSESDAPPPALSTIDVPGPDGRSAFRAVERIA